MQTGPEPASVTLPPAPPSFAPPAPTVRREGRADPLVPGSWRRRLPITVGVSVAWVALLAVAVHGTHGPLAIERPLNDLLTSWRPHLNGAAEFVAQLNLPVRFGLVLAAALVVCAVARRARAAATLAVALPLTVVACEGLKVVVDRRQVLGALAFPSGHVAVASVLATVMVLLVRPGGALGRRLPPRLSRMAVGVAVAVVVAVAVSMVVLGDHYVTDTVAGAPIGVTITLVAATTFDSLAGRFAPAR